MIQDVKYWQANKRLETKLLEIPVQSSELNPAFRRYLDESNLSIYIPKDNARIKEIKTHYNTISANREGGRSARLDQKLSIGGQEFSLNIKGAGVPVTDRSTGMLLQIYTDTSFSDGGKQYWRLKKIISRREANILTNIPDDFDRPWGGQRADWSKDALELSDGVFSNSLGMYICPVIMVSQIQSRFLITADPKTKMVPKVSQELRLMPSNIRIVGDTGMASLSRAIECGAERPEIKASEFAHNLTKTISEICSLPARSARKTKEGNYSVLEYHLVDVDKDGVIGRDGKVYFADLEGIIKNEYSIPSNIVCDVERSLETTLGQANRSMNNLSRFSGYGKQRTFSQFLNDNKSSIQEGLPKNLEVKTNKGKLSLDCSRFYR